MAVQDPVLWWTAFGAISQAVGSAATFAAVAVSLWVVITERQMRAAGSAGIRVMFAGDGSPGVYMVGIEVLNAGVRPFHVSSVGWRTGWIWRGPAALQYRFAILNTSIMLNPKLGPTVVEPGVREGFYTTVADMKTANTNGSRLDMFGQRSRYLGYPPIRAMVHITGRKPLMVKVSRELANFLRTGEHSSTTAG